MKTMLECEARFWLRKGYKTKAKVDELMIRIRKKRGIAGAEKLLEQMRAEKKKANDKRKPKKTASRPTMYR